jgi:hypothetical protein
MQNELGLQSTTEVERELARITFSGSVLQKPNWVNYNTAWKQVLQRVTKAAELQPKRMVDLFIQGIPDEFFVKWLKARKYATWEEAYDSIQDALQEPAFHTQYSEHLQEQLRSLQHKPSQAKQQQRSAPPSNPAPQPPATQQPATGGLTKQLNSEKNVNPNFKPELDMNPGKKKCSRCGGVHRFTDDMCTTTHHKDKSVRMQPLSAAEHQKRLQTRWDAGFLFTKQISEYSSPSAKESVEQSAAAAQRLHSKA